MTKLVAWAKAHSQVVGGSACLLGFILCMTSFVPSGGLISPWFELPNYHYLYFSVIDDRPPVLIWATFAVGLLLIAYGLHLWWTGRRMPPS